MAEALAGTIAELYFRSGVAPPGSHANAQAAIIDVSLDAARANLGTIEEQFSKEVSGFQLAVGDRLNRMGYPEIVPSA